MAKRKRDGEEPSMEEIIEAVDSLQDDAVKMLSTLVSFNSTLGHEQQVQDFMFNFFSKELELRTDRFEIKKEDLESLPGFSPADWSYKGRECVVATHKSKVSLIFTHMYLLSLQIDEQRTQF